METTVKTVGTNVLISIVPRQETKNGFYMPESNKAENIIGTIEIIGPYCKTAIVGKTIVTKNNAGTEVNLSEISASKGSIYRVIEEKEILIMY